MRYTEAKERSAELMRLTLSQMGRHEASFNPFTFTVWYEVVAGINPSLSDAMKRLNQERAVIDDERVMQLYKKYIAPADQEAMARIGDEMQRLMTGMAQSASHTGNSAGKLGAQLTGLTAALASRDVANLTAQLKEVVSGTAEMKASVEALQHRVSESQNEIGQLRTDLERARGEAQLDALTGILNRKGFDARLQSLISQPSGPDAGHCLVMLDIDHFKQVNDTHGHVVGDRVIQAVGQVLQSTVTHPSQSAARYGGEEFAILLPRTSLAQGVQLAEAVRTRTKALRIRNRGSDEVLLTVTISGGVAAMNDGDDAASLVSRADAALYASKRNGRDCVSRA